MFKNLFKPKPVDFAAPFKGRIMTLDEVPDPVFSSKSIVHQNRDCRCTYTDLSH